MQVLTDALADRIPTAAVRLNTTVESLVLEQKPETDTTSDAAATTWTIKTTNNETIVTDADSGSGGELTGDEYVFATGLWTAETVPSDRRTREVNH